MKELLDKYKKQISDKIGCKSEDILFCDDFSNREVQTLDYYKPHGGTPQSYSVRIIIDDKQHYISTFKLYEMPHCCAIMISCNVDVKEKYRNKGIGTILNKFRQEIGLLLGYSLLLCTDIEQNTHQRRLLKNNGWKDIYNVLNKRTGNNVFISVINL